MAGDKKNKKLGSIIKKTPATNTQSQTATPRAGTPGGDVEPSTPVVPSTLSTATTTTSKLTAGPSDKAESSISAPTSTSDPLVDLTDPLAIQPPLPPPLIDTSASAQPTDIPLPQSAVAEPSPLPSLTPSSSSNADITPKMEPLTLKAGSPTAAFANSQKDSSVTPKILPADSASFSPSRTATPYINGFGFDSPNLHTYSSSNGPATPAPRPVETPIVRRTTTVDWPLDISVKGGTTLVPFTQTFQIESGLGSVTCATDGDGQGVTLSVALADGATASLELRVFNLLDSSAPIVSLYRDVVELPEFRLAFKSIKHLLQPNQPTLLFSLTIAATHISPPPTAYVPATPIISETCSPAAIEALALFLDQPGGHDVVFCFPDNRHLYADRYILQRASRYFRLLFSARRDAALAAAVPMPNGSRLADDSDAEPSKSDGEDSGPATTNSGSLSFPGSRSPSRSESERDITTQPVLTPMTSIHGDSELGVPKYTFQRTASPLMDDNVFVMNINETSFNTFRAFLYYLYTGFISFAPLTSSFQNPAPSSPNFLLEQRRLAARNALVGEYMRKHPNRPVPVSPKSIYAVALKYEIPALEAQSLSRINSAIVNPLVATAELFSAFTRVHDHIKETQLRKVIDNWNDVVRSDDWAVAREKGKAQPDAYFATVLCEILEKTTMK